MAHPFLRIFIPGRAEHVLKLKEAYLIEVSAEPKSKKPHDDETEECDKDLIKKRPTTRSKKLTIKGNGRRKTRLTGALVNRNHSTTSRNQSPITQWLELELIRLHSIT